MPISIAEMRQSLGLSDAYTDLAVQQRWDMLTRTVPESYAEPQGSDPFTLALDALFHGPGSAPAVYREGTEAPIAIRVILGQHDKTDGFGRTQYVQTSNTIEIRNSDVAEPRPGAIVVVGATLQDGQIAGGTLYQLFGEPLGDVEGLSHACGAGLV